MEYLSTDEFKSSVRELVEVGCKLGGGQIAVRHLYEIVPEENHDYLRAAISSLAANYLLRPKLIQNDADSDPITEMYLCAFTQEESSTRYIN